MEKRVYRNKCFSFVLLLVSCAQVDDLAGSSVNTEPVQQISQAGTRPLFSSCVPHRIYSVYILPRSGDRTLPDWATNLIYPSGYLRRSDSMLVNGCPRPSNGSIWPFYFTPYHFPNRTPIGGYPTVPAFVTSYNLGAWDVSNYGERQVIYIIETPAAQLRTSSAQRMAWGELWQGYYTAGRIDDANGWPTGSYFRTSVHAHQAVIWSRDAGGRWKDEFQFGAHGWRLETTNQSVACYSTDPTLGSYLGYKSGAVQPNIVRYINCYGDDHFTDARPAASTSGINASQEWYWTEGMRLGLYIDQITNRQNASYRNTAVYEATNTFAWPHEERFGTYY